RETVARGVAWLQKQQQNNGLFGTNRAHDFIYDHAIATYAICEAFGLGDDEALRAAAQGGLDYLEAHRNPYSAWRYQPRDNDNDTSVTSWCLMACESGQQFGLKVSGQAQWTAFSFFDQITDVTIGRHGYTRMGEPSGRQPGDHGVRFPVEKGEALTAAGLCCRCLLGQDPEDHPLLTTAADLILKRLPEWDDKAGSIDLYYWYYASMALYQVGDAPWRTWSKALHRALLPSQRTDDAFAGSWDPISAWGHEGGRVYATAMALLCLQAPYRYARITELLPLPREGLFAVANRSWRSRRYEPFLKALDSAADKEDVTDAQQAAIAAARLAMVPVEEAAVAEVRRLKGASDKRRAMERLKVIESRFGKLPPGVAARELQDAWRRDPELRKKIRQP
ncbi:MAG: hypothetical protein KDC98_08085, partial [Planctomycetes bacterium]|nr:hypothetical protein [Planctomycetota bacterium]